MLSSIVRFLIYAFPSSILCPDFREEHLRQKTTWKKINPNILESGQTDPRAINQIDEKLASLPICALPNAIRKYTLNTNACSLQVGCALAQKQHDGTMKLVAYWSRLLTDTKRTYESTQRELFAIVRTVLVLRPYSDSTRITLRTGRKSLKWIAGLANATSQWEQ